MSCWHNRVRTESGSDRIKKSRWLSKVPPDPVATAPGSDTIAFGAWNMRGFGA